MLLRDVTHPRSGYRRFPLKGPPPAARQSRFRGGCLEVLSLWVFDAHAAEPPSPQQVREATEAVHNDPDLHGLKADRELRFKNREQAKEREASTQLRWLRDLVRWFSEAGRWLMWLGMAALAALLIVYLRRWIAVRGDAAGGRALTLPSHVRDLDIRPKSLPDDLPAAVRALWQRGESRSALSLLYRGALSRLVHDHAVPVRAASTEGECATLASRHLDAERGAFVARLIGLWQLAVYGARMPDGDAVLAVCDEFDARLPRRVTTTTSLGPANAIGGLA
jgi:Domain of unknown function (DUF4129)